MAELGYLFSSAPRPVQSTVVTGKQAKYRDVPVNIMFDKRVVRGPTVQAKPSISLQPQSGAATIHSKQSKQPARSPTTVVRSPNTQLENTVPSSSLQFAYNSTVCVQTDDYLEDLTSEVPECDNFAQTDDLPADIDVDRVLALFAPAARGVDAATCIEGQELFDFDVEVESILAVLVGKTLDQAEIEVNEEQELQALEKQRAAFAAERAAVIAETMRLEAENSRRLAEKQRRYEQERDRLTEQQQIARKREAALAAQQAMLELERKTQAEIKAQWKDPVEQEVKSVFMPWLKQSVEEQLTTRRHYAEQVETLITAGIAAIDAKVADHERRVQERIAREAKEARLAAEEAARIAAALAEAKRLKEEEEARIAAAEAEAEAAAEAAGQAEEDAEEEED